jgi:hypothetical protein
LGNAQILCHVQSVTLRKVEMSDSLPDEESELPKPPPLHVNLFYRLAAGLVVLFVITIFAMIANLLGNPKAPVARFLDQYALHLIVCETIGILISGTLAMTVERQQALRQSQFAETGPLTPEDASESSRPE